MTWLTKFLTSSIGKKLVMSLTGLFLILFLVVHLVGNLQLLKDDGGEAFNVYAYFMTHNPLIKTASYGLYFFILLHTVQGIILAITNRKAKGSKYAVSTNSNGSWMSKNMALLGTLIFAFICIHMGDFWYKMKFTDQLALVKYDSFDVQVKDLYGRVVLAFEQTWIVVVYIIGMIVLALHLLHGFQSAFTTLGLRHKKYTPIINAIGIIYSILIPLGFAIIPIWILIN
ncbi:MAG: succinate dehydrogenase cytochrome b subunit [Saprospiraceae bacterium]|nr:succinate dehydrogenase cytochrome b subunit [Saprospiraceae bacterium]